jgi:transcriptional regulator with XRE-family HTH domain
MSPTRLQHAADRRSAATRRDMVEQLRRLLLDSAVPIRELARVAGLSAPYTARILAGTRLPTLETYGRLAAVLGADLSVRLYPGTGPAVYDRHQAPILEHLLGARHPRWTPYTEVSVRGPSRGWLDLALHEPRERLLVASEIQGALPRLEQIIRWSQAKAESLPSWEGWHRLGEAPQITRLLVVRRTRATRAVATEFGRQLRVAYPAHPDDAVAAITGTAPWPGAAMIWVVEQAGRVRFAAGR